MSSEDVENKAKLIALPAELLCQIVAHFETAKVLCYLGRTCKRLHTFVEQDGFRVFTQTRFSYFQSPLLHSPSFWQDAAHGLTTLSRNWDRKAFLAWSIHPETDPGQDPRRQRSYFRSGQTMGFVPVIDSYESWYGGNWSSRKEVVAWGAGAGLVMRVKAMGAKAKERWDATTIEVERNINNHGHKLWAKYHEKGAVEGRDDITSVNMLSQETLDDQEQVVIGRASGGLSLVNVSTKDSQLHETLVSYVTSNRPVRSATANPNVDLLAACLSDSDISIFPLSSKDAEVSPVSEASVSSGNRSARTWCSRFLTGDRLAVGHGSSKEPIRIYSAGRGGTLDENARSIGLVNAEIGIDNRLDSLDNANGDATSVYSLASMPASSMASGGDLFLSGAYDGLVRLHDLRTATAVASIYRDPVDTFSPIYSLLPIGTERFLAGGARHAIIKVFDLRMPGSRLYHTGNLHPSSAKSNNIGTNLDLEKKFHHSKSHEDTEHHHRDWNIFVNAHQKKRRDSPIYALSRPSQCSPSFFAGIESHIVQFDMVAMLDRHPDPIFESETDPQKFPNGIRRQEPRVAVETSHKDHVRRRWDPEGRVISMPIYEHDTGPVKIIQQKRVGELYGGACKSGWDERWDFGFRG